MRAVVYDRCGAPDVLRLADVERPVPGPDEVLVKVHATTVNRTDALIREANRRSGLAASLVSRLVSGLRGPRQRILGSEFAGEVVAFARYRARRLPRRSPAAPRVSFLRHPNPHEGAADAAGAAGAS